MNLEEPGRTDLPTSLILVTSVILTVLVALFLAFSDDLQTRLPAPIRSTVVAQNGGQAATALPSATSTPTASATTDGEPTATPTPTAVSLIAGTRCDKVPDGWQAVVVGPTDTLYTLSVRYGATVGEIVQANCLETTAVFSGSTLYLPASYPTRPECGPPDWWRNYRIRRGETLGFLAQRHNTTVYAIMQANCMDTTVLVAGRTIFLPPLPATVPPPPTVVFPTNTPSATATPVPSPTSDSTPAATPSATATTASTPGSPTPTGSPEPTETPTPTATGTPGASPTATTSATPGATDTAVPSPTPTIPPTSTPTVPVPTDTPVPTATQPPPSATSPPPPSATP